MFRQGIDRGAVGVKGRLGHGALTAIQPFPELGGKDRAGREQ